MSGYIQWKFLIFKYFMRFLSIYNHHYNLLLFSIIFIIFGWWLWGKGGTRGGQLSPVQGRDRKRAAATLSPSRDACLTYLSNISWLCTTFFYTYFKSNFFQVMLQPDILTFACFMVSIQKIVLKQKHKPL